MTDLKPSRDFGADDVLFNFNRQRDKNYPYRKISEQSHGRFLYC